MLFLRRQSLGLRACLFAALCLVLMIAGQRSRSLMQLRVTLVNATVPLYAWANQPFEFANTLRIRWMFGEQLEHDNQRLHRQQLLLQAKLLRLQALQLENAELRALLKSASKTPEQLKVAEVLAVSPEPFVHEWVVNKGENNATFVGQPVLGAQGILGQVTDVTSDNSRVLLLIDPRSVVPVQNSRTGMRALVKGTGMMNRVRLMHVPQTADVQVGDVWLTSGLGLRYPAGYPVAVTYSIQRPLGRAFASIEATPSNPPLRQRHVLLLWPKSQHRLKVSANSLQILNAQVQKSGAAS